MNFLDPNKAEIIELSFMSNLQLDFTAEEFLNTKASKLKKFISEKISLQNIQNKPICFNVTLFENKDFMLNDNQLMLINGLILSFLTSNQPSRVPLITELPESLNEVFATDLSILGFINFSTGHPIQIIITRTFSVDGEITDTETVFLV